MISYEKKTTGILTTVDMKKPGAKIAYWTNFAVLLIISVSFFLPPLWIVLSSLKDTKEFLQIPPTIFPKTFHPEKIGEVWKELNYTKYYFNTLILAAGDLVFMIIVNGLAGYVLSRLKPKGTALMMTLLLWTMMLPQTVSMIPLFKTFIDVPYLHINLSNTYLPMWLQAGASAFYVMLFKNFFDTIPISFVEAARIDGCTDFGIFIRIILPLSLPIIMAVSIFTVNNAWGAFFWPFIMIKKTDIQPIAVQLYNLKQSGYVMDKYMVALVLSIIPPALMFIIFQKNIMGGINIGGVKE